MSYDNRGANWYTHFRFADHKESGSGRYLTVGTLCNAAYMPHDKCFAPRVENLSKVDCPTCKVAWDFWLETSSGKKPCTLRRFRERCRENRMRFTCPEPPPDRELTHFVTTGQRMFRGRPKNVFTKVRAPANTPDDVLQRMAMEQKERDAELTARREAEANVEEKARRLERKRAQVARLETKLKRTQTLLKKAKRSLAMMERHSGHGSSGAATRESTGPNQTGRAEHPVDSRPSR